MNIEYRETKDFTEKEIEELFFICQLAVRKISQSSYKGIKIILSSDNGMGRK